MSQQDTVAMNDEKQTILFVDDEESILDVATEFFEHKGYNVKTASNGLQATHLLENQTVDCCFTDINMPEMDGLELAEYIRKKDNTIPVIIMTGYPSLENTIKTLKNGVVDFLIKPVNLNQMEICVQRVLRERQLFIENILLKKEVESKLRLERLNKELNAKVEELNLLNNVMSDFTTVQTSSEIFRRMVETTVAISNADEARLFIIHDTISTPIQVAGFQRDSGQSRAAPIFSESLGRAMDDIVFQTAKDAVPLLMKTNEGANGIPSDFKSFMAVPLKIRDKIFGVLFASIFAGSERFGEKSLYYLSFMSNKAAYAIENLALYDNIYENLFSTLYAFVKAIEAKDPYTQQHSSRVTSISKIIGRQMGCTAEEMDILNFAGPLHDIGKIGIRDEILLKPGKLTEEEFEIIKGHPSIGASIVGQLGLWDREKELIEHHHERFDGTGYPAGLKGEDIPGLARILSVADAYDAMASDRAYRKKMPMERVLRIIREGAGSQFDPNVVSVFLDLHQSGQIE